MPEAPASEPIQPAGDTPAPATAPPVASQPAPAVGPPADPAELTTLREQAEQLTEQAAAAQHRAEAAELDLARLTVIRTAQLPDALASRLNGTTAEELATDAAALAGVISALVAAAAPPARTGRPPVETLRPAASAPAEPVEDTPEQISRLVWGR